MNTELTTQQSKKTNLPAQSISRPKGLERAASWNINQRYLTLLHPTSNAIGTNDNLKPGQIINSETQEIVGGKGKAIEGFFVYYNGSFWVESHKDTPTDIKKYPMTKQNCMLPWEEKDTGIRRKTSYELYFMPKGTKEEMPYLLTFSGASAKAAKGIITFLLNKKADIYTHYFSIDSASKTGKQAGNQVWYLTAKPTTPAANEDIQTGIYWEKQIEESMSVTAQITTEVDTEEVPF